MDESHFSCSAEEHKKPIRSDGTKSLCSHKSPCTWANWHALDQSDWPLMDGRPWHSAAADSRPQQPTTRAEFIKILCTNNLEKNTRDETGLKWKKIPKSMAGTMKMIRSIQHGAHRAAFQWTNVPQIAIQNGFHVVVCRQFYPATYSNFLPATVERRRNFIQGKSLVSHLFL